MFVEDIKDVFANLCTPRLYFLAVTLDHRHLGLIALGLFLLLDGGYNPPGGTSRANDVLVCNRKRAALLDSKFSVWTGKYER
jgi:hypothetical protein